MVLLAGAHFRPPDEVANKQARGQGEKRLNVFQFWFFSHYRRELQQILPVARPQTALRRPRAALVHEGHHFRARHIARIESLDVKAGVLYQDANCTVEMAAA